VRNHLQKEFGNNPFRLFQSDNGGEFKNALVHEAIAKMNGKPVHSAARHPQSQGQVERVNQTIKDGLDKAVRTANPVEYGELIEVEFESLCAHSCFVKQPVVFIVGAHSCLQ